MESRRGLFVAIALGGLITGCGDGDVSIAIEKTAADRPDLTGNMGSHGELDLPASQPFNLTSFASHRGTEAGGETSADSGPIGNNGARCTAGGKAGGSSDSSFILGYMFDNQTGRILHAVIVLHLQFEETIDVTGNPAIRKLASAAPREAGDDVTPATTRPADVDGPAANATTQLVFQIKDSNGAAIHTENLALGGARGSRTYKGAPELTFDADFEPSKGYYLVIYGACNARSGPGRSASAELKVEQCRMKIEWRPAQSQESPQSAADRP